MAEFPLPMSEAFLGTLDNPAISQSYRKAVIRPAPISFTVSVYPPRKQGANFHYGMRIIPTENSEDPVLPSGRSTRSTKTGKSKEYDIFRRWDDCLDFQRTLEGEYEFIYRRRRKGQPAFNHQARNALYPTQRAASFDSLPLGPDPSSIPADIHVHIPKLTKKSSLFRVNHTTVSQRGEEFKAMIEALLDEDAPSTIQELRTVPVVRDFFALWRRDKEAERRSSKVTLAPGQSFPPLPEPIDRAPVTAPVALVSVPPPQKKEKQVLTTHLTDFLHTSGPSTPKSPKPSSRNSYAPPRSYAPDPLRTGLRPSTANTETRSATSSVSTNELSPSPISPAPPLFTSFQSGPSRLSRSQSVPFENGTIAEAHQPQALEMGPRSNSREPLVFRALSRDEGGEPQLLSPQQARRPPIRKGSTPELSRLPLERRPSREVASPLTRNNTRDITIQPASSGLLGGQISGDGFRPMPVSTLSPQEIPQHGRSRKATLRETPDEIKPITPLTSFPFDHPLESPTSPGIAGVGVGRTGPRNLGALAVLDPELYHTLSAQQAQVQAPAQPWANSPPAAEPSPIPRARKTPPILDSGNRSARFFVDDPTNGAGLVDMSNAPPPRSPTSAVPLTMRPDFPGAPPLNEEDDEQFGQIAHLAQRKALKLSQPPLGRLAFPDPPNFDPSIPRRANDHTYTNSVVSGNSTNPTLSSSRATSSWSSQSPVSPTTGVPTQRYRSRISSGSIADPRRFSLDSLIASEFEAPYLSRNIAASHQNKSSDAVYMAINALAAPSVTPTPRGRASYSSLETDSTGLDENSGAISSSSSLYGRHGLPPSKAAIASKSTPPPRPPRSALRNSSQFSAGVISRLNESLANAALNGEIGRDSSPSNVNNAARHESVIDSYMQSPSTKPALLEPPANPFVSANKLKTRDSNLSAITNFAQYYQESSGHGSNEMESPIASVSPTPFSPSFDVKPSNSGTAQIKAIHADSDIIVLVKVPREASLDDLRVKLRRKFQEAGVPELGAFSLKYQPPRGGDNGAFGPSGRQRSISVTSTSDVSSMINLNSEVEWQNALKSNSKIIIRLI